MSLSRPVLLRVAVFLLAAYVVAGTVYACLLPGTPRYTDETEYLLLSQHLLHGPGFSLDGVHLTASRSPGYPFFLVAIEALGGGVVMIRILQYLLVIGTVLLMGRLMRANGLGTSVVAAGLVMLYPVLFYTGGTLYPQILAGFLFMAALAQMTPSEPKAFPHFTAGLTFGALILVIPTFALILIVVLVTAGALRLIRWRGGMLMLAAACLVVGSWTLRNTLEFHRFVPVASNGGYNFLIGNNENTTPYGGAANIDISHYGQEVQAQHLDEFQADHFFRSAALTWIAHHPGRAAILYFEKTLNFFNVWNAYAPWNGGEISLWKQAVMGISYLLLLGLLAWRLAEAKSFPLNAREKFCLIVYVTSAFVSAIFFTRIRLRLPFDYLMIALIAAHLARRFGLANEEDRTATERTSRPASRLGN